MVRLLLTLSVVGAAYLLAPCCASVIKTANEARLASRELFYYYDIDSSMSMPCSKIAKSKKGQHPPPPPPKSKKGVYPPPTKHPKGCKHTKVPKGKGKGGKGKGGAPASKAPTHTTPPIPNIPTMPSAPSTMAPSGLNSLPPVVSGAPVFPTPTTTIAPGPPTPGGSTVLQVTNFEISYTIDQQQIPTTTDYDGLTSATSSYLQSAFQQYFLSFPAVLFSSSLTLRTNQVFNLNQPVIVDFNTTVTFSPGSQQPAVSELDGVVNTAFTTNNANYLAVLTGLQGNIFSTTTVATFSPLVLSSEKSSTTTAAAAKTAGIAVAAGAGAFIVLVGAIMVHRRRGDSTQDDETLRKFNEDGHMTVAGDTFVGTLSLDSGRHADDDGGAPSNEWEGFAKYSTAKYRTNSPTSGNESDGTDGSDGLDGTNSEKPRRTLETVDL